MAYVQEGLCLYDHREGTNFSRCMWLMLRRVCDCVITGRELISIYVYAYVQKGLWLFDHREGTNFSGCMWLFVERRSVFV